MHLNLVMKKLILIALLFSSACSANKEDKAKKLVKLYLDSSLNDPHSYEPIKFSKLDTLRSPAEETIEYKKFTKQLDSIHILANNLNEQMDNAKTIRQLNLISKQDKKYLKEQNELIDKRLVYALGYKGKPEGFSINHRYRAKNSFGALGIHSTNFKIDSNMTKIWDVKENY